VQRLDVDDRFHAMLVAPVEEIGDGAEDNDLIMQKLDVAVAVAVIEGLCRPVLRVQPNRHLIVVRVLDSARDIDALAGHGGFSDQ